MPNINGLFVSSDFDTLKNDGATTATINIPASAVIAPGATAIYDATVSVGQPQSMLIVMMNNNIDYLADEYFAISTVFRYDRTGSAPYGVNVFSSHTGGSNVKVSCVIWNGSASPLTLAATAETWRFVIRTIQVPRFV